MLISFLCLISSYIIFNSYRLQYKLVEEYNSQSFTEQTANKILLSDLNYPNISVTTIPLIAIKASYLYSQKKYEEALSALNEPIRDNPNLFFKESLKSKIFRDLQIRDSAEFYAKKAFFGLPKNPVHFENLAIVYASSSNVEGLVNTFNYVKQSDPQIFRIFLASINVLNVDSHQKVKDIARNAKKLFPNDDEIVTLSNFVLYGKDNVINSQKISEEALQEFEKSNYSKSIELYLKCIELNPSDSSYFENAGLSYFRLGEFESAIQILLKAISMPRSIPGKTEYLLGLCYLELQDKINACKYFAISQSNNFKLSFNSYVINCK